MREAGAARAELAGLLYALRVLTEAIQADLELLPQGSQQLSVEHRRGLRAARLRALPYGHAARIVHHHRHYVLARLQRGDADGRMPQHEQQQGHHGGLEQPDHQRPRAAQQAAIAPHVPQQQPAGRHNSQRQNPPRPRGEQNELPPVEHRAGILE